ncbi:DUF1275 domain-containing protein [Paracoccus limosus]|uniref:DUF1275 domain-containing protein n=1 Tax=Paracoccus limosus TaxID=913252 RepID=A0A844H0F1_9RHOB|nr:YoaK family protein [Paracoccus limosus]MTH34339.1 DUF1275 domain-containing protein [Paracoccus limosus]
MKLNLPMILSFNAGYVDTAGFLSLHGLFTAHVTGNLVMIGDALANGSAGIIGKLLALPMFCLTILILQSVALRVAAAPERALRAMLVVKFLLLSAAAISAIHFGSFPDADGWPVIQVGMLLVAAMAVQNAAHRIHLGAFPPSTLMTGTTTQIMLDLATLLYPRAPEKPETVKPRIAKFGLAVLTFVFGCALAALAFVLLGVWCFVLPPVLAIAGLLVHRAAPKAA